MKTIAVIMPTYNEAANIGKMVEKLYSNIFSDTGGAAMHLVVVDDQSPDGTGSIVQTMREKYDNLHLLSDKKQGLGHAYVRGFTFAMQSLKADAVVEMDADFQHDPEHLKVMIKKFLEGADYIIGSRFMPGGSIPAEWAWYRKAISLLGNYFARAVLRLKHIHDLTTGFRLTRVKGVLDQINLPGLMALERFAYKVDLLYKTVKLAQNVVEIPIHFAPRKNEKSKFNFMELIVTYRVVLRLRFFNK